MFIYASVPTFFFWTDSKGAMTEMYIAKELGVKCAETIEELKKLTEA
jgi:hypothetical protein